MKLKAFITLVILVTVSFAKDDSCCTQSEPQLERVSYFSEVMQKERDYFVYLPPNYESRTDWPVILFLHGNGERGNGKDELDYVLKHGPLFEAWSQKKDLPFIIISPQLPMWNMGSVSYIANRTPAEIPHRLPEGIHPYPPHYTGDEKMEGKTSCASPYPPEGLPQGWPLLEDEVMAMLDHVLDAYQADAHRVYLTGISYGGFGTWYLASKHPERFAAISPVVGYAHTSLAAPIAESKLPVWVFAGGRDNTVPVNHFYPIVNKLEELGHPEVCFTIHADMSHDTWVRVYSGQDIYNWFLQHTNER